MLPDFFWICEKFSDMCWKKIYTSHKNCKQLKIYPLSFLLNENSYLALMSGQTPLKILQMDIISFNLTTKLLYGDNYSHFTKNKNKKMTERFKCHVEVTTVGHWEDLSFSFPVSMLSAKTEAHTGCTVNAQLASLNSAWIRRQRAHMLGAWLSPQMRFCQRTKTHQWKY